jgi:hypothetical protein
MAEHDRVFGACVESTRELVDASLHTLIDRDEVEEIAAALRALTARLPKEADQVDGHKTTVEGHILGPDGEPTVEADGLFILPRWAREAMAAAKAREHAFE